MGQDSKTEFKNKFKTYSGNRFEICYDIYCGIMSNDEKDSVELFTFACNNFGITDSDSSFTPFGSGVSKNELDELKETYGQTVDTLLDAFIQKAIKDSMPVEAFYENIWNLIVQNPIFPSEKEKAFALYYLLIDARIPYFPINPGLEMNNAEYRNVLDNCSSDIQKAKFILAVDFPQKTMEASNLLNIILSHSDYKEQTVIMSKIVMELRDKNRKLLDNLLDRIKEDD